MLNSCVRLAFDASVLWTAPPVSCQIVQVSIVPRQSSPRSARSRAPGTFSRIHATFGAEKNGESCSPVFSRTMRSVSGLVRRRQSSVARLHCQTIDSQTGSPVLRSQTATLSRWFVTATAATCAGSTPASCSTRRATRKIFAAISDASWPTQPLSLMICRCGTSRRSRNEPYSSRSIAFVPCVLWSMESM